MDTEVKIYAAGTFINALIYVALVSFFWEPGAQLSAENLIYLGVSLIAYLLIVFYPVMIICLFFANIFMDLHEERLLRKSLNKYYK